MTRTSDETLIAAALKGRQAAFAQLVERHRDAVCSLAFRALDNRWDDAQDVTQEAFVYAFLHLRDLRDPSLFGAWVRNTVLSRCADFRRRRATRAFAPPPAFEIPDTRSDPASFTPERLLLRDALSRLPEAHRVTLSLFAEGGYSHEEIAALLAIPLNTVRSRLQRVRRTLSADLLPSSERSSMPVSVKATRTAPFRKNEPLPVHYEQLVRTQFPDARILSVERYPEQWMPFHYRIRLGLPNKGEKSVDIRAFADLLGYMTGTPTFSPGGTQEAELLETLRGLGLPVPTVIAGPFPQPANSTEESESPYALTATPEGKNLLIWSLESHIPHRVWSATNLAIEAIDRMHGLTDALQETPAGKRLPRRTLLNDLEEVEERGGPWAEERIFAEALRRLRPVVEKTAATTPLVYTNDYYFPNFLRVRDGAITEYVLPWGWFGDPLLGLAKFWTYDCYPFVRTGFVERYLYEKGLTKRDFAPRLAVRALWTIQRELPVVRPDEGFTYWDALTGYLRHAMEGL